MKQDNTTPIPAEKSVRELAIEWWIGLGMEGKIIVTEKYYPHNRYYQNSEEEKQKMYLAEQPNKGEGDNVEGWTKGIWTVGKTALTETTSLWVGGTLIATMANVPHEGSKANAQRIVTCVNNFDSLVGALKEVLGMCEYPYKEMETYKAAKELLNKLTNL